MAIADVEGVSAGYGWTGPPKLGLTNAQVAVLKAQYEERMAAQIEENRRKEEEKRAKKEWKKAEKERRMSGRSTGSSGGGGRWSFSDRGSVGRRSMSGNGSDQGMRFENGFETGYVAEGEKGFEYRGDRGTSLGGQKVEEKRGFMGMFRRRGKVKEDEIVR